jgi:hypothetical protein
MTLGRDYMTTPIWLLDIDGVINAWDEDVPYFLWPEWTTVEVPNGPHHYPIKTAHGVRDFICRVHEEGLAEIRWHTTWQHDANRVGTAVGLPEFPVQPAREHGAWRYRQTQLWKVPTVFQVAAEEGRPVLWTDDDARQMLADHQLLTLIAMGCTVIAPDGRIGLAPQELEAIEQVLRDPPKPGQLRQQLRSVVDGTPA